MKVKHLILFATAAALAALLLGVSHASASTSIPSSGGSIMFANETDAKAGMQEYLVSPGESITFAYPTEDGASTDVITESSEAVGAKSFDSVLYQAHWTWKRVQLGDYKWTWEHYTEWAGAKSCVATRYANSQWSDGHGAFWYFRGAGDYFYNQIVGCVWYAGKQGHYEYCVPKNLCFQDDWPWQVGHYFGWGAWNTINYGR
jgi:hypothetical protein